MSTVDEKNCAVGTNSDAAGCCESPCAVGADRDPSFVERAVPQDKTTQSPRGNSMLYRIRTKIPAPKRRGRSVFSSAVVAGLLAGLMVLSIAALSILIVTLTNVNTSLVHHGFQDHDGPKTVIILTDVEGTGVAQTTVTAVGTIESAQTVTHVADQIGSAASVAPLVSSAVLRNRGETGVSASTSCNTTTMVSTLPAPSEPATTGATDAMSGLTTSSSSTGTMLPANVTSMISTEETTTMTSTSFALVTVTLSEASTSTALSSELAACGPESQVTVTMTVATTVYPSETTTTVYFSDATTTTPKYSSDATATSEATDAIGTTRSSSSSSRSTIFFSATTSTSTHLATVTELTVCTLSTLVTGTGTGVGTASGSIMTSFTQNGTYSSHKPTTPATVTSGAESNTVKTPSKSRSGTTVSYCVIMALGYYLVGLI
ncbi:hypothetical protein B0T16DRAFT_390442 [Cercophora newfieldiana]|uniref:Uncharacterized protein n=1 Tax=Cercophora newfieldiana TaxID=92897 RepID=A0AA39Y6S4_9PEZI|nr:hypothetical protein B0T16DRAFT_390442 [Cercophora newfieldiana]